MPGLDPANDNLHGKVAGEAISCILFLVLRASHYLLSSSHRAEHLWRLRHRQARKTLGIASTIADAQSTWGPFSQCAMAFALAAQLVLTHERFPSNIQSTCGTMESVLEKLCSLLDRNASPAGVAIDIVIKRRREIQIHSTQVETRTALWRFSPHAHL